MRGVYQAWQRMPFSLEIKNAVEIPKEVNQHKLIIHLRLLKIINDGAFVITFRKEKE